MSYYEAQSWQIPARQATWDQPPTPSRTGTVALVQQDNENAFETQIEEVDRAIDNLNKSGKLFGVPSRRDSMPMLGAGRPMSDFDPRLGGAGPQHRHSIGDYEQLRPHSGSNLQSFYAHQRHQPRPSEAEQMLQAKRRMAAQRERELRNYHQEQQYNRNVSTQGKSDRAISPNTMNEEDRRELIARQHRALYGSESSPYGDSPNYGDENTPRASVSNSATSAAGGRGPSPRSYDSHSMGQGQAQISVGDIGGLSVNEHGPTGPSPKTQQGRSRADSTSSPASNPPSQNFSLFENTAQQSSRTSTSSPGGSPPRQAKTSNPGVAPIGTRPTQGQAQNPGLTKRSTTSSPSPLGYNFSNSEHQNLSATSNNNERSTSAASDKDSAMNSGSAWGTGSGVWGNKSLQAQASVWG